MGQEDQLHFGPFRFDPVNQQLWRGDQPLPVQPKPLAVLRYLVEHPERLVTKEELLQQVWPGTYVTPRALIVCINAIRKVLGDAAQAPQYIETVGQYGYRFIGAKSNQHPAMSTQPEDAEALGALPHTQHSTQLVVGREREVEQLQQWWAQAQRRTRQLVFVTGEAGIGKTTLVNRFLDRLPETGSVWIGRGQCIEHYGRGEAYLPVLEALGRLGRLPEGGALVSVLKQYAPSWLVQLPALVEREELEALPLKVQGTSQQRMLRELAEAMEVLTAERPLVLVLEDLQWSDASTLELLAAIARRQEPARLLVIGTYRPAEVIVRGHPLRPLVQELAVHGQCQELQVELLPERAVEEYVAQRLGEERTSAELGQEIHQRTDGNALFMVHVLDYLLQQGVVVQERDQWVVRGGKETLTETIPKGLQQLIVKQLERLRDEEQQVLAVAGLVGGEFTAAAVAAGSKQEIDEIEAVCDRLAQREQFVEADGLAEWPDGTVTASYRFRHVLYQQVLHGQVGEAQRARVYQQVGEREEMGYGTHAGERAGKLAAYFEEGREYAKAVQYRQQAAQNALRRRAYQEATEHCEKGIALLSRLPDTPERRRQELAVRTSFHVALSAVQGYAADDVEHNLHRMHVLCQDSGDVRDFVPALIGLGRFYLVRADRTAAVEILEQEERLLARVHDPDLAIQLHTQLCLLTLLRGEYERSRAHGARVLALYNPEKHALLTLSFGLDLLVNALTFTSCSEWLAGRPDEALRLVERGLAHAEQGTSSFSLVFALIQITLMRLFRREPDTTFQLAQRSMTLAQEYGFSQYSAMGLIFQGCALVQRGQPQEGLAMIRDGLLEYQATGAQLLVPLFLSFQAAAYGQLGRPEEGLRAVTKAFGLTATNLDVFWEAELYRLKGELLLQSRVPGFGARVRKRRKATASNSHPPTPSPQSEAEACFQQALEIARRQDAKSLELRAALSLSRLWQQQSKKREARQLLSGIYGWFTEGFDTTDLQEAKVLITELGGAA